MKKLTLMLTVALMAIATTASAQFANSSKKSSGVAADTENYNRISVAYSPLNIEKLGLTGISAGWTKGINVMQGQPLFLEVGVNVMYGFGKDDAIFGGYGDWEDWEDWEDWGYDDYYGDYGKPKYTYLGVNIPILVTWKFAVSEKISIAPYAGVNLRGNIIMESKEEFDGDEYKTDYFDSLEKGGVDAKRFGLGASFGVNFDINKFSVGVGYTTDFTEFAKKTKIDYLSIAVGLKF